MKHKDILVVFGKFPESSEVPQFDKDDITKFKEQVKITKESKRISKKRSCPYFSRQVLFYYGR